ncbi:nuclear transport factor 2 family protein [Bizionia gelidisalsuginis]|uniref:Nuclear transport factor 2 family protein n=1 Tax=Bizionia gelidisalsuginis TaxID=291188 RepID=A0ABY3M9G5_9FLAO|nr:nuclear transport factor 2 family protein [Bizionia gelidisalsuginis]TYC11333.1 nuclear transport factor 2 family protein [Bizionia gelidisalsuginis]
MRSKRNNKVALLAILLLSFSCNKEVKTEVENQKEERIQRTTEVSEVTIKETVNTTVNLWHKAAAEANFDAFFNVMTSNAVFIGTDASENWQVKDFKAYAKPHFEKGKAWNFTPIERNVYVSKDQQTVWFDELLHTQMKICRGSGVLTREDNQWKIAHYVLSIAIPNPIVKDVIALKKESDSLLVKRLIINKLNTR